MNNARLRDACDISKNYDNAVLYIICNQGQGPNCGMRLGLEDMRIRNEGITEISYPFLQQLRKNEDLLHIKHS